MTDKDKRMSAERLIEFVTVIRLATVLGEPDGSEEWVNELLQALKAEREKVEELQSRLDVLVGELRIMVDLFDEDISTDPAELTDKIEALIALNEQGEGDGTHS